MKQLVAVLPFGAAIAAVVAVHAAVSTRLPEPLATHFGADFRADGYSSGQGFLTGCVAALLALGAGSALLTLPRAPAAAVPWLGATRYAIAAAIGSGVCLILLANAGMTDASAVRMPPWDLVLIPAAALLAGALGYLLAGRAPRPPRQGPGDDAPRLDLPSGTTAGWSRTISSMPLVALGALLLGAGAFVGLRFDVLASTSLLGGGAVVLALASVRVTVDRRGLTLAPLLLPLSRIRFRRIPLDRVREATSRRIDCLGDLGGWGYRVRPGASGLALRSGDGIVVRLTNGREFMVTVDDAATAAALLNTYADRARARVGG
ncbi:hypothetical protein SSP35_04_00430 [Streptomyces sp. NBRC 110611]|uniref:hypothetical protein n=1 Tax=Streptomyces sp. NBRC 110611 TaxID=1621259 RepID=UPI00085848D8|nr:hypothetical protein [Streptomyces sp. NBRC 110611]GAU66964.1 hypothetical protein SSP35_04_00430 [Streptomyces sp. NBRC 110611]